MFSDKEINYQSYTKYSIIQLCWYREGYNGELPSRAFILDDKYAIFLKEIIYDRFPKEIEEFGKRCEKKGSNLLFQLHSGNLTTKDFDKNL